MVQEKIKPHTNFKNGICTLNFAGKPRLEDERKLQTNQLLFRHPSAERLIALH
jgi:hypothetical protein